jgi:hypothetical protein
MGSIQEKSVVFDRLELPLEACFVPAVTTYFDQVIDTIIAHQSFKQ